MHQEIPCKEYVIEIGFEILPTIATKLQTLVPNTQSFILITDNNVGPLYASVILKEFEKLSKMCHLYTIPAGEASKTRQVKAAIEDFMLEKRMHRDSCVLALGGGVVGDLAGFVAATYMRGVPFVQIPTSLLACVDSSIGGKTGIDCDAGKNLIGAFHQPKRVFVDLCVLDTLPKRELVNGMGEIIKAGAINSEKLFQLVETNVEEILNLDPALLFEMIAQSVSIKAKVVNLDEKEHGIRSILNFGHSIGHGIEALIQPELLHGECVAIGMVKEAELARLKGYCSSETVGRLIRCIKAYNLPTRVPSHTTTQNILKKMEVDKKNVQGVKKIVLLTKIGQVQSNPYIVTVSDSDIALILEKQVSIEPDHHSMANGSVRVPGSKSISNRVLLLAALGKGTCRIKGLLHSDDTQVMIGALLKLGANFTYEENGEVLVVEA